jgi:hypothetical protein
MLAGDLRATAEEIPAQQKLRQFTVQTQKVNVL